MATNYNVTLKRGNGTDFDTLYPVTSITQVIGLSTALSGKVNTTAVGANSGVAPLDSTGKIPVIHLPDSVFDSLIYKGAESAASSNAVWVDTIVGAVSAASVAKRSPIGYYFVISTAGTLTNFSSTAGNAITNKYAAVSYVRGDNGAAGPTGGDVEAGDWVIINSCTGTGSSGDPYVVTMAVINNVYEVALTNRFGIVQLSNSTTTATTGTNVVTDSVLNGLIGTAAGKIAAGDHNHNAAYLGINATAANATKLATARSISMTGDVTWSIASFDGSGNVTAAATLANSGVTASTYRSVTVDAKGRVTAGTNPTTLAGYGITDAQALDADLTAIAGLGFTSAAFLKKTAANTWALDTNAYLTGNQSISITGDATGTGTTSISLTLANSGVTASTYRSVTVDAKGRVTAGTNPTTLAGYGITDAYTQTATDAFFTNRPQTFYNTTVGAGSGDIIIADVVAA